MQDLSDKVHDWFERLCLLSPDPSWVIKGGSFVECNQAAVTTLGYGCRDEIVNLHPSKLSPPLQVDGEDSFVKAERMMAMAIEQGQHRFEWIHQKADGTPIDVEVTLSNITVDQQNLIYCAWRDISRRKRLERALQTENERIASVLNKVPLPIFLKDNEHRIVVANDAFCTMFGSERSHVLGRTLAEQVPEVERSRFLAVDRAVLETGVADRREETLTLHDQTRTIITSKTQLINDDGDVFLVGSISDVSELKQTEKELRRSQLLFESMAETLPLAVYVASRPDQLCEYVNPEFVTLFGYTQEEIPSVPAWTSLAFPDPEYREQLQKDWRHQLKEAARGRATTEPLELRVTCKDGTVRDVAWNIVPLGNKTYAFGQDLTERKREERERAIAATAFEAQEGMVVTDGSGAILKVNAAFSRITGYSAEEVAGENLRLLQSGRHDEHFYQRMWESINRSGYWEGEIWNRRKSGEVFPEFLAITAVKDSEENISNFVGTFSDITQRKAAADEIKQLAFYDPLTKLPNRRLLLDRLRNALAAMSRTGKTGALLFLDLDNFKNLNDSLGHNFGDLLLQQVAARLEFCMRQCDTVSRLGGDEFIVMLADLSEERTEAVEQASLIANKIATALRPPYELGKRHHQCTASIGITMIEDSEQSVDGLLKQADIAMYQSKSAGRDTVSFFDPQMQEKLRVSVELEQDLRQALLAEQFELHYQVQVNDKTQPVGAEALIRWHHPKRGLLGPSEFIPFAETSTLIIDIENWALDSACKMLKSWQAHEKLRDLTLAVNVGARHFRFPGFVTHIDALLKKYEINPERLKLELTESLFLVDVDDAIERMNALRALGVRLALDDFGTGYSSLQYLKRLPLEELKIDQSFIHDIETDADDRAIVSTIIAMAKNLGVRVIAEGVETEAQKEFLIERGCDEFQGYLFGRPNTINRFLA